MKVWVAGGDSSGRILDYKQAATLWANLYRSLNTFRWFTISPTHQPKQFVGHCNFLRHLFRFIGTKLRFKVAHFGSS